jgi:hypothetical protein
MALSGGVSVRPLPLMRLLHALYDPAPAIITLAHQSIGDPKGPTSGPLLQQAQTGAIAVKYVTMIFRTGASTPIRITIFA